MTQLIRSCTVLIFIAVGANSLLAQASSFGPGTHLVGSDIQPGLYRTDGEVTYFERLSGLSGEFGDILANEASPEGPVLVEIKETDVAFRSEGPAIWTIVDESYQPELRTRIEPGWWLVGRDIKPGLYRTEGEVRYFARLAGLAGDLADILANEAGTEGPVLVEIKQSDVAFQTQGSAVWEFVNESYSPTPVFTFGAGWWLVGKDIAPGLYRTEGEIRYFARLSGLSGDLADILANEAGTSGPVLVEIHEGDIAFQTRGDGVWTLVDNTYAPSPRTTFADGWWIVGVDILPGVYRTPDDVRYYARLSGFGHELSDIIANAASEKGGSIIEFAATDAGFETKSGAVWSLIEDTPTTIAEISWGQLKALSR